MMPLLAALAGALVVGGILALIWALQAPAPQRPQMRKKQSAGLRWARVSRRTKTLLVVGVLVGIVVAAISGILLLLFVIPAALVGLPLLLGKEDTRDRDLLSALESWARSLASTAETGSFTLREVIAVTRLSTPPIIRVAVDRLHSRMAGSWSNADALREFAEEMDNAWVDEVVIYLVQASEFNAGGLSTALDSLADNLATQVKQRMVIYNERDKPRRTLVTMTGIIAAVIVGIVLFSHTDQLAVYATPFGGVLLAVYLGIFGLLLVWAKRQTKTKPESRIIITDSVRSQP